MANMAKYNARVVQKHDTKANWDKATNFIPLPGEIIVYDDLDRIKIGDGVTTVVNLPFSIPTKEEVGLGNVDNTSDADKPVSSAQSAAIQEAIETARTTVKEAYLKWGGKNLADAISPIDAAASDLHSANRFQFAKPEGITIEYSTDGGTTWYDYESDDASKVKLVSGITNYYYYIGKKTSNITVNDKLRITLNADSMGVYALLNKMLLYVDTHGASGCNVTIERSLYGSGDSFETKGIYNIAGWPGWNSIPVDFTFGNTHPWSSYSLRLTFGITGIGTSGSNALSVLNIVALGVTSWAYPSEMARAGHLYSYDYQQNVTFPANVTASSFVGELSGNASSATKATQDGNGNVITSTYATKDTATASANGLMSSNDKNKLVSTNIAYATCSTSGSTAIKEITIVDNNQWNMNRGSRIVIKFTSTNLAYDPMFSVNGRMTQPVMYNGSQITTSNLSYAGYSNRLMEYVFDGTYFVFMGWSVDNNTTYTNASLGQGYATCTTAADTTAKTATLSSYSLIIGGIVSVEFEYAVPASATLNINGKGAKSIYYRGGVIPANIIKAGDIATFIYYGSHYHLISIDRLQSDINSLQTQLTSKAPMYQYNTTDLTAGTSSLATGTLYFVYE